MAGIQYLYRWFLQQLSELDGEWLGKVKSLGEYEKNAGNTIVIVRPKKLPQEMQSIWTIADSSYDIPDKWTRG